MSVEKSGQARGKGARVLPVLVMAGAALGAADVAVGAAVIPIKFNSATLTSDSGRRFEVRGPLEGWCDPGTRVRIQYIVSQESTGAVGRGSFRGRCSGEEWVSRNGRARGRNSFEAGSVEACGLAVQRLGSRVVHVKQWCADDDFELESR